MKREPPKPPTPRHDTEGEKEEKEMNFVFCEERKGQRIDKTVCEANVKKGKCIKDLLKCKKAKTPKATDQTPNPITDLALNTIIEETIFTERHEQRHQKAQLDLFPERKE